jgi:hypothetical protein
MNLQDFASLKVGDEIVNHMRNDDIGVVASVTAYGITLKWPPSEMLWSFTNQSTAWMHWSKKEPADAPSMAIVSP